MKTCQVCGQPADKLRDTYELRPDGVAVSKMACLNCHRQWLAKHSGLEPERTTAAELREWQQGELELANSQT